MVPHVKMHPIGVVFKTYWVWKFIRVVCNPSTHLCRCHPLHIEVYGIALHMGRNVNLVCL